MFPSEDDVDISRNLGPLGYKPRYTVNEVNLMGAGDLLLLMTDGITEHENSSHVPFVPDRLEDVLRRVKHLSPKAVYEAILEGAAAFGPQNDDMTLVVVKRGISAGGR